MFKEKIYFKDDLIDEYLKGRKGLVRRDIEDLLNCLIKFLEKDTKREEFYAYHLPRIGTIHRKYDIGLRKTNEGLFNEMLIDIFTNGSRDKIRKKEKLTEEEKEEYQQWQNGT